MLLRDGAEPTVSVVMVLWNAAPFLSDCVAALQRSPVPVEMGWSRGRS